MIDVEYVYKHLKLVKLSVCLACFDLKIKNTNLFGFVCCWGHVKAYGIWHPFHLELEYWPFWLCQPTSP